MIALAASALVAGVPVPSALGGIPPGSPVPLAADASCDERLSAADLPALVRLIAEGGAAACGRGDIDGDGEVDATDLGILGDRLFEIVSLGFDFRLGAEDWVPGFSDYATHQLDSLDLEAGVRELPPELAPIGTGFYLHGFNVSDDLFMFLTHQIGAAQGVRPGGSYDVVYDLRLASNAPSDCFGIGGAPGESVFLKAGASPVEPVAVQIDGEVAMNVDKGEQIESGPAASLIGNIANGIPCDDAPELGSPYVSLQRRHLHATTVTATSAGDLWLLVGTDSGFEGPTGLYYQRIRVDLVPSGRVFPSD